MSLIDQHLIDTIKAGNKEIVNRLEKLNSRATGKERQQYNISFFLQAQSGQISADCAEITFINLGTGTATLNGVMPIAAGASISISGNENEIDKTAYSVIFTGGTAQLIVVRKYYLG